MMTAMTKGDALKATKPTIGRQRRMNGGTCNGNRVMHRQISDKKIRLFCSKYIELGCNGSAAYRAIHPAAARNTAKVEAHRYLTNPNVQNILQPMLQRSLREARIDREWVLKRLIEQTNASPLDYFKVNDDGGLGELAVSDLSQAQRRNLKSIKVTKTRWGESITVTVHDQQRALSILARIVGMFSGKSNIDSLGRVGDLIEKGVNAIRKHKNLNAWKDVIDDDQSSA